MTSSRMKETRSSIVTNAIELIVKGHYRLMGMKTVPLTAT